MVAETAQRKFVVVLALITRCGACVEPGRKFFVVLAPLTRCSACVEPTKKNMRSMTAQDSCTVR